MDKAPDAFRTISEVAEDLDIPQHVLRFWESRFPQIKPMKRAGGRRYYRPDDVDLLRGIRHLLYGEGYTIRGVQRILKEQGPRFVQAVWQPGSEQPDASPDQDVDESGELPLHEAARSVGLLKGQQGADIGDGDDDEPDGVSSLSPRTPGPVGLSHEQRAQLQQVLEELTACRLVLESALKIEAH